VEPRCSDTLIDPQLGAIYGGTITVELTTDEQGKELLKLPVPRFDVLIRLDSGNAVGGEGAISGEASWHPAGNQPDLSDLSRPNWVAGQPVWARVPGKSATLWLAMRVWFEKKWTTWQAQAEQG
jgi:hypothetical protein